MLSHRPWANIVTNDSLCYSTNPVQIVSFRIVTIFIWWTSFMILQKWTRDEEFHSPSYDNCIQKWRLWYFYSVSWFIKLHPEKTYFVICGIKFDGEISNKNIKFCTQNSEGWWQMPCRTHLKKKRVQCDSPMDCIQYQNHIGTVVIQWIVMYCDNDITIRP